MTADKLMGEDLIAIQQEKGNICVSVIMSTHRLSPERRTDAPEVEKAVHVAVQVLENKYNNARTKPLVEKLCRLHKSIDFNHSEEGVDLYASPTWN